MAVHSKRNGSSAGLVYRILLGEIERGVAGDFLEDEFFHAALRIGLEIRIIGVEDGLRHAFLVVLPGRVERRLGRGIVERLEPDRRGTRLGRAVRVNRLLDGHDASRRERFALVVVLHQHRLLDGFGDLRLPAEHVGDRRPEDCARAVVHVAFVARAQPLVDIVRFHVGDGKDFFAVELLDARVGDCLRLVRADALLREVHEGLEHAVVSVDVESHCLFLLKVFSVPYTRSRPSGYTRNQRFGECESTSHPVVVISTRSSMRTPRRPSR